MTTELTNAATFGETKGRISSGDVYVRGRVQLRINKHDNFEGYPGIGRKYMRPTLDVYLAGKLIYEGFEAIGQKLSEMCKDMYFRYELLYIY